MHQARPEPVSPQPASPQSARLRSRVTLQDVADRAGVSLTTASRVVNEGARRVGPRLADRVNKAVAELGYTANLQARAVATGQSTMVGIVVHDIADPYFTSIAAGLIEVADAQQLLVCMSPASGTEAAERAYVALMRAQRARAVILIGSRTDDAEAREALRAEIAAFTGSGGRAVCVGQDLLGVDTILPENAAGALGAHQRDVLAFGRLGGRGARHADQLALRVGRLDEAGRDGGEVRVGDVVHDHADHRALTGRDRSGLQVCRISEVGRRLVDAVGQRLADLAPAVAEHPRRGGQRHPGPVGDVLQGHPRPGSGPVRRGLGPVVLDHRPSSP